MFERFTDRARRVVVLAQEEARLLNHNYIGTEHILLGLIHEGEGVAFKALQSLNVSLTGCRLQVETIVGRGSSSVSGHLPFTPRCRTVLELGLREALQLGHNYIGTEHILLGLVREGDGIGMKILGSVVDGEQVRQAVIKQLSSYSPAPKAPIAIPREVTAEFVAWVLQYQDTFGPLALNHPLKRMQRYLADD